MRIFLILWIMLLSFGGLAAAQDAAPGAKVHVGVLAHRGTEEFEARWAPLRDYLNEAVPQGEFHFYPVTLLSASGLLAKGDLHFLITNPGHYVALEATYPMSILATRRRALPDGNEVTEFGSVIFSKTTSGIAAIQDVAGKDVIAVDQNAFGGFQMAWREFHTQGIDPFSDFGSLTFVGFPQDRIVEMVLAGEADVGVVRSGLIEALAREKGIDIAQIRVLNENASYTHPEKVSTRLYPEWPFLAVASTEASLRDAVALALLSSNAESIVAEFGLKDRWAAPVTYHAARELVAAFTRETPTGDYVPRATPGVFTWIAAFAALAFALFLLRQSSRGRRAEGPAAQLPAISGAEGVQVALTPREEEILELITEGQSTKEIALALEISPKTVEFHRSNLLKKYGAKSSLHLVKIAKTT